MDPRTAKHETPHAEFCQVEFWRDLHRWGGNLALVDDERRLTYEELEVEVDQVAHSMGPSPRLLILEIAPRVEAVVRYLAALRGGHPAVLVPPGTAPAWIARYPGATPFTRAGDWQQGGAEAACPYELHPDLAVLLPTSGSTGSPKLVRLSHENIDSNARAIAARLRIGPDDRAFVTLPLHYSYGLSVLHSHLAVGASVVLNEGSVIDGDFAERFEISGATNFAGVPHTFHLLDRAGFDFSGLKGLRFATQAGGRLEPERVAHLAELSRSQGWRFHVMYGQTEATARISILDAEIAARHPKSVGTALPGGSVSVTDPEDDGGRDGRGEDRVAGELIYRGPNVMLGYASRSEDLARGRDIHELRTGDLAEISADGLITLLGRASRRVKPAGVRVDLDALERQLADEGVDVACAGDDNLVVVAAGVDDLPELAASVAVRLELPLSAVKAIRDDRVPRLASGKVDGAALVELARREADVSAPLPSSVLALFRERFGPAVTPADSFVSCGGDSLTYIEVSVGLEDLLGNLPRNWHQTSIAELERLGSRSSRRRMETSVVLRAVAIALIVGTHSGLWSLPGGAHVLLAVAGFNFARFQRRGRTRERLRSLGRIALPSFLWIGGAALLSARVAWPQALGVNTFAVQPGQPWQYWFIEALMWLLVGAIALISIPVVRRLEQARPMAVATGLLLAALAVRFEVFFPAADHHRLGRPVEVAWLFTFGWAAAVTAGLRQRLVIGALGLAAVPGFFGSTSREALVAGGLVLLLLVPTIPVPRLAVRPVALVASASLYIYLVHWQVYPVMLRNLGELAAFGASLIAGLVAWWTAETLMGRRSRVSD